MDAPEAPPQPVLTPAEERFERRRRTAGFFLGPLAFIALFLWPPSGLGPSAQVLASILGLVVVFWVTEPVPLPVTALLGAVLCVVFGVAPADKVLAPFADKTIFLFLGSFLLAEAMAAHGLNRRFACAILASRWVGGSTARLLFAFGAVSAFTSMWISNVATTVMMLPIGIGLVQAMADLLARRSGEPVDPRRLRFGTAMMLMAAYAASTGGIGTPVGTPPNLIGLKFIAEQAGRTISFFEWMLLAVPLLVVLYGFLFVLLHRLNRPELPAIPEGQEYARRELARLGPWSRGERNALGAFLLTVALWIAPAAIALLRGSDSNAFKAYDARMPEAVAAMAGGILLFLLPVDWKRRQFTLDWQRAARIDWGTLLLYGGGISLGRLMFESGLAEAIGSGLLRLTGFDSLWGITFATIVTSILVSEVTSNTATASMIVPVAISLARAAGFDPLPPALGATLGASWGFMLPVATPPNAVVYGTGMIPITKMIRAGIIFDVLGAAVIWTGLRVMVPALGW